MTLALAPALLALAAPGQTAPPPTPAQTAELAPPLAPAQTSEPAPPAEQDKLPAAARALEQAPPPALAAPRPRHAKGDPLEGFNRRMFRAHERFDRAIFRPAAMGYKHAVPKPVRAGLRNFFSNLTEPIVFLNYLLQLKPGKAAETLTRFAINSSLGLGGVLDLAKTREIRLPHRPNGFGDTLALYGVKPGPYLFLPFVGPTTLRDLLGGQADGLVLPIAVGKPFDRLEYQIPHGVITGLDARAQADDELKALFSSAVDPYATLRSVYLQSRAGEIDQLRGHPTAEKPAQGEFDDPLTDPAASATTSPPSTAPELQDPLIDPAAPPTSAPDQPAPEPQAPFADPAATPAPAPAAPVQAAPAQK